MKHLMQTLEEDMNIILKNQFKLIVILLGTLFICVASVGIVFATGGQTNGHFVGTQSCRDAGTILVCKGKVGDLGGKTFQINVKANAIAVIECENPGGNVVPGQDTKKRVLVLRSTGLLATPESGFYRYTISTKTPTVPDYPTCPSDKWTAHVVDVIFKDATLTLLEDNVKSDQETVSVE